MGTSNDFKDRLRKGLESVEKRDHDQFREVVAMLRDTASVIREFLQKGGQGASVSVDVVPGHLVNAGREHRIVVRAPSHGVSDYLLRAYIPTDGYPVVLDSVDEEDVEYPTSQKLQQALVKLVKEPWFQERLSGLREVLREPQQVAEAREVASGSQRPRKASR
jgi:hypothetical protein